MPAESAIDSPTWGFIWLRENPEVSPHAPSSAPAVKHRVPDCQAKQQQKAPWMGSLPCRLHIEWTLVVQRYLSQFNGRPYRPGEKEQPVPKRLPSVENCH